MNDHDELKGINGQPCIGPCLPKDSVILHPIYLYPITDYNHEPFCPTFEWYDNKNNKRYSHDIFKKPTNKSKIDMKDIELLYALPNFGFDCGQFLKNYYDLYSFEGVSEWLNQHNNPNTK